MVKISIIMPVYNDAKLLNKSINSFLNQTLDNIELICINDGSTDNSLDILNNYSKNYDSIKVFSQKNSGSGKARNYGINQAEGEYIGFLDADDFFIDNDALEKLYETAVKNDANFVTGNIKLINSENKYSPMRHLKYYTQYSVIEPQEYGIPWSFYKNIYKTEFIKKNNIKFPDLLRGQDPVFLAEIISKVDKIYTVPSDVYAYFYINGANSCNTSKKRYDHMRHYKMVFDFLKDSKFKEVTHKFRYEFLGFIKMMGVEGAEDILNASRDLFDSDSELLHDFEEYFYYFHKDNNDLNQLVQFKNNPNKPRISIIIPIANVEKYIEKSIESILDQTFVDFEILCVNDNSQDNSLSILNNLSKKDSRIKIINTPSDMFFSAKNEGLKKSRGKYIYFFNPCDILMPKTLEKLYFNAIINESDLVIFKIKNNSDDKTYFDFKKVFKKTNFNKFTFNYKDIKHYVMNSTFYPWSKLYKKSFLEKYDDLKFDENISIEDIPFHIKSILRAQRISFVPKIKYNHENMDLINDINYNDIFKIFSIIETFLKDNNYFDELTDEYYQFYIDTSLFYLILSNSEEYYNLTKKYYNNIDTKYVNNFSNETKNIYNMIIETSNIHEFQLRFEILNLKKEIKKIEKQNEKIKKESKHLKTLNDEIIYSNSWKLTKPLRKIMNLINRKN